MKIEMTLSQGYHKVVLVFRGWATARDIAEEVLTADSDVEVTMRAIREEMPLKEEDLPLSDTDFDE